MVNLEIASLKLTSLADVCAWKQDGSLKSSTSGKLAQYF